MNLHEQARAEAEKRYNWATMPERDRGRAFISGFLAGHEAATADDDARIVRLVGVVNSTTMLGPQDAETVVRALVAHAATRTRVVTTVTELGALPVGSVVLNDRGVAWQKRGANDRWYCSGLPSGIKAVPYLPARVLYDPEETR